MSVSGQIREYEEIKVLDNRAERGFGLEAASLGLPVQAGHLE